MFNRCYMLKVTLNYAANTPGTDTATLLFQAVAEQHPTQGITMETHELTKVQHFSGKYLPDRSIAEFTLKTDISQTVRFVYDRFRVDRFITNPVFTAEELEGIRDLDENELSQKIATKLNLNINNKDFVIRTAGIQYTGGEYRPNWRLQARHDSPFWYGSVIIWLNTEVPQ